jgi:hypothetical protein
MFTLHRVLKARQRRLRGQIKSRYRIAVQQHLVNGIGPETGRVVGIRIAAGNREHALCQQLAKRMIDLARLPLVFEASSQAADQFIAALGRLQQDGSAIRTALPLIELQYGGLGKNLGNNKHSVVVKSIMRKPLLLLKHRLDNMFLTQEAFAFSTFKNDAG